MPVRIKCPHCLQELRLPNDLYYVPAQCPLCRGAMEVRWRSQFERRTGHRSNFPPFAEDAWESGDRQPCRYCGTPVKPWASRCSECGEWLDE